MHRVESPDQCEAFDYGSSFARAVEIRDAGLSRIYVSGTASIDKDGETIHVGDVEKQTRTTLRVVRDLLAPSGHSFDDIAQGVMFLKNPAFVDVHRRAQVLPAGHAGVERAAALDLTLVVLDLDGVVEQLVVRHEDHDALL